MVSSFLLPPGLFVTTTLFLFFLLKRRILLLLALFIWIISFKPLGNFLLEPLESTHLPITAKVAKAVVILGGGKSSEANNLPTSASGTKRILYGLMLADQKRLPALIAGCEGVYAKKTVKEIINAFHLNINFTIEDKSLDTYQNALFTRKLLKSNHIILVTSAYHMPRSYKLFTHFGFKILPAPTDYKVDKEYRWQDFLPSLSGMKANYLALHEYLGLMSLKLRGIE